MLRRSCGISGAYFYYFATIQVAARNIYTSMRSDDLLLEAAVIKVIRNTAPACYAVIGIAP